MQVAKRRCLVMLVGTVAGVGMVVAGRVCASRIRA